MLTQKDRERQPSAKRTDTLDARMRAAVSARLQGHRIWAPAINWTRFIQQELWGEVLMNATANPVLARKLATTAAALAAFDAIDGVKDDVIEDPHRCTYDPKPLVDNSTV